MPGSRKGERRGGAKPGRFRKTPNIPKAPGKRGRPKNSPNKSKFDPVLGVILNKKVPVLQKEQELEMYFMVVGKRMRLPKEVMLDAMRYFEETAIDWGQVVHANMMKSAAARTPKEIAIYEAAAAAAEMRMREYLLMTVDVAYKAAPFLHPRLAALITNPGSGDSPLNAIAALFKDLDEAGQTPRFIDHDPNERAR